MDNRNLIQDNISFSKGMIPQLDPINLPEGAYLDALNMMRNEVGIIGTECGTSSILNSIPGTIVGVINVDDDIIVCSTDNTLSYIGRLDSTDTYTAICSNNILKFNTANKLSLEYKQDYKKDKILYIGGKGVKLRHINLNTVSSLDPSEFDKVTSLFLEYELPITSILDIKSGGAVKTGVYQFACRLVTESGDITGFGLVSELFPVIGESVTAPENVKVLDGDPPQSSSPNLLSVQISNIDTAFKYIEPCVITYLGEANTLSIRSLGKKTITSNIMIINYTGASDELDDILQEEIMVNDVQYTSGNYLTQKDNTLIIAGLTEEKNDYDWQSVANSIAVTWFIEPLVHDEPIIPVNGTSESAGYDSGISTQFNSYRNPKNVAKYKGYKRGEVYSFTFTPIINGRIGNAYHIPAMRAEELALLGFTTNLTGIVYTDNTDASMKYPTTFPKVVNTVVANSPVRYHRMPDNYISPFVTVLGAQKEQHNVLGLNFNITSTADWKSNCTGYIIGRENRRGKETIGAQGVCKRFYRYSGNRGYGIIPNFNSMFIEGTHEDSADFLNTDQVDLNNMLFCAPDIITNSGNLEYTPTSMRKLHRENMSMIGVGSQGTNQDATWQCKPIATRVSGTIVNYPATSIVDLENTTTTILPSGHNNPMQGGSNITIQNHAGLNLVVMRTSGGLFITTKQKIPFTDSICEFWDDRDGWDGKGYNYNPREYNDGRVAMDLYELLIPSINYYGNIYNKESFTIGYKLNTSFTEKATDTIQCFGGDTYISKYAMVFKDGPIHHGSVQNTERQAVPFSSGLYYFTLESQYNYYYRHYIVAEGTVKGSTPYYPKQNNFDEVLNADLSLGNAELYNKQYSAQNNLQTTYTSTVDEFIAYQFPNRIIYSATSIEGEKVDSFRFFKINNYHDIPKQYGNITGLFAQGSDLFIHTERALWKAFYNVLVTQATSAGEVVLGNGGAFSRPSVPIVSLQGGYAGCKDISASIGTPLGRFFYDFGKSKLYLLGEGLQEVSNPAVFQLLRDTIGAGDVTLGYDYGRKRVLLSSSTGTLSFKPELQSFDSRHNYTFSHFISRGLKDYIISGNRMHYFDTTVVGRFFDTVYNSFIKVASVVYPSLSKRYVSAEVVLTSQDPVTKVNSPWAFFQKLKMYSRERNTGDTTFKVNPAFGEVESFSEILVSKANNKFRFGFAPDIVDDINVDIQDPYNLKSHSRFSDSDRIFLPDMVDNHVILEFTIDNNQQKEIKIQSLIINFDQNVT